MNTVRPRFHIRDILKFTAIVCFVLAFFSWSGVNLASQADWRMSIYPFIVALVCAFSIMRPKPEYPRCESCGRRVFPLWNREKDGLCPGCRAAKASPDKRRRLAAKGFIIVVSAILLLAFVAADAFAGLLPARLGGFVYLLIAIGLFVILVGGTIVVFLVRVRRMSNPAHALKVARALAGDIGEETTFGPASVYWFGASAPTLLLEGPWEICKSRFESLFGEPLDASPPLRVLVFGKRAHFDAFFRAAFLYSSNLDGVYVPWSTASIAITTEFPDFRLTDPERVMRVLFTYFHLDAYRKRPSPLWVQIGVANVVATGRDEEDRCRLNRKMLAALSRGDSLGTAELFHRNPRSIYKLVRDWQDFDNFRRHSQLITQSFSVVDFLCCDAQRLKRFRAFLREPTKKSSMDEDFQRHFDHGFDALLEQWRQWVLDRGVGTYAPPSDDMRDALAHRLIPIVEDEGASAIERIQAVREMGRVGYALGADTLIDLLSKGDQVPSKEIIWALESISGLALGNDVEKWTGWFNELPSDVTDVVDMSRAGVT